MISAPRQHKILLAASFTVAVIALSCGGGSDAETELAGTEQAQSAETESALVDFKGSVVESGADNLVITSTGGEVSFVVTETTVFKDPNLHDVQRVQKGDRVVVQAEKQDGRLVALRVRLQP